jgi:phage/plasmid-associated DNA primase
VCAGISGNEWFQFKDHTWEEIEDGKFLRDKISTDIHDRYARRLRESRSESSDDDKAEESKRKVIVKLMNSLKTNNFKNSIMKECKDIFYDKKFKHNLNMNPSLIAFQNGVYDLKLNVFRDGRPEDYLSKKLPFDYTEFEYDDEKMREVRMFLEKVFPDISVRDYFMDQASDVFVGGNHQKVVNFWTGEGDNGKSVTQTIFEQMLGRFAIKFSTTVLTGKKPSSGSAFADLARAGDGTRWAIAEEPDGDEEIQSGVFKHLSGNDSFYGRDLFQRGKDVVEITPMFKLVFICLVGSSKVSMSAGVSFSIKNLRSFVDQVVAYGDEKCVNAKLTGFMDKGLQKCIQIRMFDGRVIQCTRNHRFLTNEGIWIEAQHIVPGETALVMSVEHANCNDILSTNVDMPAQFFGDTTDSVYFELGNVSHRYYFAKLCRLCGNSAFPNIYAQTNLDSFMCDLFDVSEFANIDSDRLCELIRGQADVFALQVLHGDFPKFAKREVVASILGATSSVILHGFVKFIFNIEAEHMASIVQTALMNTFKIVSVVYKNTLVIDKPDDIRNFIKMVGLRYAFHASKKLTILKSIDLFSTKRETMKFHRGNPNTLTLFEYIAVAQSSEFFTKKNEPWYFMKVASKTEVNVDKQVFDISVEEPFSSFIANGIVTHNCNKLPRIKHADRATWNRVRVIPFESTFCRADNPAPTGFEEQLRQKRFPMDTDFSKKIPGMIPAFAYTLLEHRKQIKARIVPPKVMAATEMYKKQNDMYRQFIDDCITIDVKGSCKLGELYSRFVEWFRESFPGKTVPTKFDIKEYFQTIWGAPANNGRWDGHKLRNIGDDNEILSDFSCDTNLSTTEI